jgi:iron complex transport system permease protein
MNCTITGKSNKNFTLKPEKQITEFNAAQHAGRRNILFFTVLALLLVCFFILDIFLGSVSIKVNEIVKAIFSNTGNDIETIILKFRLPKAITAITVGIALSLSGLQMQTVFRNPMAGPYVLGISSGASLGVAFVILGFSGTLTPGNLHSLGNWILVAASWIGAGAVTLLIMFISSKVRDIMTILIIGMMLASGISAIVSIMQYFSNETLLKAYVIWTMGSLGNLSAGQLQVLLISVSAGILISIFSVKMLNALLLGENYAGSIGLNVRFSRAVIFTCTSILAGSVTAFCGPIGFIGIAVPHIARIIFKTPDHRVLIPGTILIGALIMLISDIVSQLPGSNNVLPVNSVTSLIGIPVVIWVILNRRKDSVLF